MFHAQPGAPESRAPDTILQQPSRLIGARQTLAAMTLGLLATIAFHTPAQSQSWPNRSVTFIVSQSAGSSPDVMARMIADRLTGILGQGVVIENKAGGGNVIGAVAAARSAPDGYTFFFGTSAGLATNPFLMKKLPYDPVKDFAPVALVTRSHQLLLVHPDTPAKTLSELIALDKKDPGKLSIAVDSPRNLAGITAQALNKKGGINMVLVSYPNINSGIQDAIAGRVQVGVFSVSVVEGLVADGKLRPIAVASARRSERFPDLQAAGEVLPGFDLSGWFMLLAPSGTPAEIVTRMNAAVDQASRDPKVRDLAPKLGFEIEPRGVGSPAEAAAFLSTQLGVWEAITKDLGLEPL